MVCILIFREMSRRTTEEQAKKAYERAIKTEQEFGEYFTGNCFVLESIIPKLIATLFDDLIIYRRCSRRYKG